MASAAYTGASLDVMSSSNSGESSSRRNPCWGWVFVNRILRESWVAIASESSRKGGGGNAGKDAVDAPCTDHRLMGFEVTLAWTFYNRFTN